VEPFRLAVLDRFHAGRLVPPPFDSSLPFWSQGGRESVQVWNLPSSTSTASSSNGFPSFRARSDLRWLR
jgi:hypothetical protein